MAVGIIVFTVVAHKVVEREAIVGCYKVDAAMRIGTEQIGTAPKPLGDTTNEAFFTADVRAHVVAKLTIPLRPGLTRKAIAKLIRTEVPRLGDQTKPAHRSKRCDLIDERAALLGDAIEIATQQRAEVETKAIDPKVGVATKRGHDEPGSSGMRGSHNVSAASCVVVARARIDHVIRGIVDAA
ncbi:unannotated protein [freshwater metagenome]|uniref:Unannotated protein n=1 Tax=freshwater metagenome TaxID=449393 RepID=A0A6J6X9A8_9ZZZZ